MILHRAAQRYGDIVGDFNDQFPQGSDTPGVRPDVFAAADAESDALLVECGADLARGVTDARQRLGVLLADLAAGITADAEMEQDGQSFTLPPARALAAYVAELFGLDPEV